MEKIIWQPDFEVGVTVLDQQHRQIVEIINRLVDDLDAGVRSSVISDRLAELSQFASAHFKTEEKLLAANGYPQLALQKESHSAFCEWLITTTRALLDREPDVGWKALEYAVVWWREHILGEDRLYSAFLAEKGVT